MRLHDPFRAVMPSLSHEQYAALKADIELNGLAKAILTDEDNNIIDGHHRYKACVELGVDVRTEVCSGLGSDEEKRLRIITLNLTERDLTGAERRRLAGTQKRAALKLLAEGKGPREVGRLVGCSHSTVISWRDTESGRPDHAAQVTDTKEAPTLTFKKDDENTEDREPPMTAEEQKERALKMSASGVGAAAIAASLGRPESTVKGWLRKPEARVNAAGPPRKLDDAHVLRLWDAGHSRAEIAAELEASAGTVTAAMKRLGIGRAGKKAKNPLASHTERADAEGSAWDLGADSVAATAEMASPDQVRDLASALDRLAKAAGSLRSRLKKEAARREGNG